MRAFALGLAACAWIGCAETTAEQPQETTTAAKQVAAGGGITPEQNDAIDELFRRKAPHLQTCWADEYEKTQNRKLEGDLTVQLMVTPSGKPEGVKILKSSMGNQDIENCVVQAVAAWRFPEVGVTTPYVRTVHLGAQF
jgi:TonB family protein